MNATWVIRHAAAIGLGLVSFGCGSGNDGADVDAGGDTDTLNLDISVCAVENGPFTPEIDNPYLPFVVGSVHKLEGLEGGTDYACFRVVVPGDTAEMGGVTARVVEKIGCEDGGVGEAERTYFAQAPDGTVCIYGEDGEWEAGQDGYEPRSSCPGRRPSA